MQLEFQQSMPYVFLKFPRFSSSSDAANIPVVRDGYTQYKLCRKSSRIHRGSSWNVCWRARCVQRQVLIVRTVQKTVELPQLQFIDVESTLRDKFQQSSACGRCLRPVHRQSRTNVRHLCVFSHLSQGLRARVHFLVSPQRPTVVDCRGLGGGRGRGRRESDSQVFCHVYCTISLSDCGLHRTRSVVIHTVEGHV